MLLAFLLSCKTKHVIGTQNSSFSGPCCNKRVFHDDKFQHCMKAKPFYMCKEIATIRLQVMHGSAFWTSTLPSVCSLCSRRPYNATSTVNYPARIIEEFDGRRKRNEWQIYANENICWVFLLLFPHPSPHASGGCLKPCGVETLFFSSEWTIGSRE